MARVNRAGSHQSHQRSGSSRLQAPGQPSQGTGDPRSLHRAGVGLPLANRLHMHSKSRSQYSTVNINKSYLIGSAAHGAAQDPASRAVQCTEPGCRAAGLPGCRATHLAYFPRFNCSESRMAAAAAKSCEGPVHVHVHVHVHVQPAPS